MAEIESPDNSVSVLKSQVAALERQVFSLLLALIVVSGTVTIYLYRQASLLRKDIEALAPQANQIIKTVNDNRAGMSTFLNQLAAYGQTHPDFEKQIMQRNGLVGAPGTPGAPVAPAK
jgi:DNA integrity scanning protein DisA with diadenylate cyclase activity